MIKKLKLVTLFTMVVSLLFLTFSFNCFAADYEKTKTDADKVLRDNGISMKYIKDIPLQRKIEFAEGFKRGKVHVVHNQTQIDEFSIIEEIINTSDSNLKELYGLSQDQIDLIRNELDKFKNMTDDEIQTKYSCSEIQVKLFRKALTPNENYKNVKKSGDLVSTSTISTSVLDTTQYVLDLSSINGRPPVYYSVMYFFTWLGTPIFTHNDTVAIGWGGNLATSDISGSVYYTGGATGVMSYNESPINAGLKYDFNTRAFPHGPFSESGHFSVTLQQNYRTNTLSKVISQYSHKILVLTGGISINANGPNVSISIGYGYDSSPQQSTSITY